MGRKSARALRIAMSAATFRFANAGTANRLVAGVPAAARLARAFAQAQPGAPLFLQLGDHGSILPSTQREIDRLAPGLTVILQDHANGMVIAAETVMDSDAIAAIADGNAPVPIPHDDPEAALRLSARQIIRATSKPGDGIVSRYLNRPVSQAVSALLLRWRWIRPGHATAITALTAIAMLACLLTCTWAGLVAGAVLFQLASIIDGIDGEIARATFRTSASGAAWDSAVDAATNLGFLAGVIVNLWFRGETGPALIGLVGLGTLAAGMLLLGIRARLRAEPLHFDGAKQIIAARETAIMRWLRYVTMRDFYCLFLAVMIALGLVTAALTIFALAAAAWLVAIMTLLGRDRSG